MQIPYHTHPALSYSLRLDPMTKFWHGYEKLRMKTIEKKQRETLETPGLNLWAETPGQKRGQKPSFYLNSNAWPPVTASVYPHRRADNKNHGGSGWSDTHDPSSMVPSTTHDPSSMAQRLLRAVVLVPWGQIPHHNVKHTFVVCTTCGWRSSCACMCRLRD